MKSDRMRFLRTLNVTPSVDWGRGGPSMSIHSVASLPARSLRSLPLPKLGLNNSCWNAGVRWCGNRRASHFLHLTYGLIYSIAGGVQFTAGIYFMMALPIFQLGSNIWTGAWNMFSGIVTIMLCCFGHLSMKKAQGLLLMSLVVTVVNLINLLVLEVGEWRGFLSQADEDYINQYGLNYLMKSAYICTTLSTIVAMVASFLGSQHTFCFLQLQAEEESARKISGDRGDNGREGTGEYSKELIKRHEDDGLNLKTPGPKPHPSWVYRYNMTTEERIGVQRSLSLLQHTKTKSGPNGGASFHHHQRLDMLGPLPGLPPSRDLSPTSNNQISTISDKVDIGGMRHAIIRRHNSMYTSSTRNMGHSLLQPPYKLHDVSGASEVRPIVTLQRSKTSITPSTGPYYRAAALQSVARSYSTAPQFRQYVARYRQADVPLHGTATRYKKNRPSRQQHAEKVDQFCEFQAGSSFDLPNLVTLQRARNHSTSNSQLYDDEHNYSAVMFETDDGKTTSKSSRLVRDTETSSNENIRYQAMDMIKKDTRVHRKESTASRSNSMNNTRRYYSSWDNLLERSEVNNSKSNLITSQQYGSTGSVNSYTSDQNEREETVNSRNARNTLFQAAGHHLQLHAVHNTSYQTNTTLETCLESDENDLEDLRDVQLYDVPRKTQATVKKSNSRVSSNGKLSLRVESFKQSKNSSGTQTDLSSVARGSKQHPNTGYIGQYKKAQNKQAPSKPVRKHKRKSSHDNNGDARSPSPANSSTSGYSSPSLGLQSKESSPPLSKTPSPGQSLDIIDQQKDSRRSRMRNAMSPSKHASEENEERITVISITPQHITSPNPVHTNNSLRKSSLKQSSKYGDSGYNTDYASLHPVKPRETSDESNIEEYQIEDIEREIQRKTPEDDQQQNDHYRGHVISNENRRVSADDGTLRKSGSKIATNGSLQIHKKHQNQSPVRQASVVSPVQSWHEDIRDMGLNEEVVDDVDIDSEENEHYASVSDQHHYSTLRKGSQSSSGPSRYQRNSHFSQFSRLPPVPERPSLENREISPVPDIVSPTSPILTQSFNNFAEHRNRREGRKESPESRGSNRREMRRESLVSRNSETLSHKQRNTVADIAEVHTSSTLGRRKSRIPTAAKSGNTSKMNRSVSDTDLGTESVDERLETLLHLLGGSRNGTIMNSAGSNMIPPDLVSGTPGDTLQYLSQLEMVARKLKHQLIKQKQDDRQGLSESKPYKAQEESEC